MMIVLVVSSQALGDSANEAKVRAYLEEIIRDAKTPISQVMAGKQWSITTEWGEPPSATEVAELEQLVAGKPDHPRRSELEEKKIALVRGVPVARKTVTYYSDRAWRISSDYGHKNDTILDSFGEMGRRDVVAWSMTKEQINIVNTENSPPGYQYAESVVDSEYIVRCSMWLAIGADAENITINIDSISATSKTWSATISSTSGVKRRLEGVINNEILRCNLVVIVAVPDGSEGVGAGREFSGWRNDEVVVRPIATRVRQFDVRGKTERVDIIEAAVVVEPSLLEALCVSPKPGVADPVRGIVKVQSVVDHRPNIGTRMELTGEGDIAEITPLPTQASRSRLQIVGWGVLGFLVIVLIVYRWRRSS